MWSVGAVENKGEKITSAQVILLVSNRLRLYFPKARRDTKETDRPTFTLDVKAERQVR